MRWTFLFCTFLLVSCGGHTGDTAGTFDASIATQTSPVVTRVDPKTARAGDLVTVFGSGFSTTASNNVVLVGAGSVPAASYGLVSVPTADEVEQLTFVVPTNVNGGVSQLIVNVLGNTSNSDVRLTIIP